MWPAGWRLAYAVAEGPSGGKIFQRQAERLSRSGMVAAYEAAAGSLPLVGIPLAQSGVDLYWHVTSGGGLWFDPEKNKWNGGHAAALTNDIVELAFIVSDA